MIEFPKSASWAAGKIVRALALGALVAVCTSLPRATLAANGSVTYTYDALGRILTASYDTGVIIIYVYDANGNRTQQVINVNTTDLTWTTVATPCASNCWGSALWALQ